MTDRQDLLNRIRLIRTYRVGPVAYRQLLMRFGSAGEALDALPELSRRGKGAPIRPAPMAIAEKEIAAVEKIGATWLVMGQGLYPRALAESDGAPPLLIAKGNLMLLERPMIAMVGARNASAAACRFARGMARELGDMGRVVVSGLARGIDTAAHDGAMETGTIGCAAGGIDIFYPPENDERQRRMMETGIVLSERPPGTEPQARDFPRRNRIIAGLAAGTLVVEAAPRSGSLITARLAAEMGREVMAVPGSPLDPRAQGCNMLIRDGATLVQNAQDVVEALGQPGLSYVAAPERDNFTGPVEAPEKVRDRVEALLGPVAVTVDELVRQAEADPGDVQLILLELDLAGRLDRHAGGKVSLAA